MTWKTQGTGNTGDSEFSKHDLELFGNYEVSANGKKYELRFAYISRNDFHPDEVGLYALGVEPYDPDGYTASGAKKPFWVWASQFSITVGHDHTATGDPGVYVPQK